MSTFLRLTRLVTLGGNQRMSFFAKSRYVKPEVTDILWNILKTALSDAQVGQVGEYGEGVDGLLHYATPHFDLEINGLHISSDSFVACCHELQMNAR